MLPPAFLRFASSVHYWFMGFWVIRPLKWTFRGSFTCFGWSEGNFSTLSCLFWWTLRPSFTCFGESEVNFSTLFYLFFWDLNIPHLKTPQVDFSTPLADLFCSRPHPSVYIKRLSDLEKFVVIVFGSLFLQMWVKVRKPQSWSVTQALSFWWNNVYFRAMVAAWWQARALVWRLTSFHATDNTSSLNRNGIPKPIVYFIFKADGSIQVLFQKSEVRSLLEGRTISLQARFTDPKDVRDIVPPVHPDHIRIKNELVANSVKHRCP